MALRGSLRAQLLLTGTLSFFLYTYMSMSFNTAYNQLFLVYVTLFSFSLFAFILSMMSFDLAGLPQHFSAQIAPARHRRGAVCSRKLSTAGLAGTHCAAAAEQQPTAIGKHDHPGHPGDGPGFDRTFIVPGRHPAAKAQRMGLSAGLGGGDEIPDNGDCS